MHCIAGILLFHHGPATGGDDATYIALARSLIERRDYTNIGDPALLPHTQYPPVFSGIVSLGLLAGLSPEIGLRIMAILISALAVLVTCYWLQRVTTTGVALCAGILVALSPEILRLARFVLSDAAFWCLSILALLAWWRGDLAAERKEASNEMPLSWSIAASIATIGAYFTRSAGAPLLLATFLWLFWRGQRRAGAVLASLSIPLILAWAYRGHVAGSEGYLGPFLSADPYDPSVGSVDLALLAERGAANVSAYITRHLPRLALGSPVAGPMFGGALAVAVLYGWARRLRHPSLPEIWFPAYVILVMLWPVTWSGPRFLLPVVPLLALYSCEAIASIVRRGTYPTVYAAVAVGAVIVAIVPELKSQMRYAAECRADYSRGNVFPCTDSVVRDFLITAREVRGKLPEGSVVLTRKPSLFYHYSGYRSTTYPMFAEPDSLFRLAARVGARYVVADRMTELAPKYLVPALTARRESVCIIGEASTHNATLFRIEPEVRRATPISAAGTFPLCDRDIRLVLP